MWTWFQPSWDALGQAYFVAAAAASLLAGSVLLALRLRFLARSSLTSGEVVGHRPERDSDARSGYAQRPVLRFTAPDGRVVEFVGAVLGPDEVLPVGRRVRVRFDPGNPAGSARRAGLFLAFALPVFLIALGVMVTMTLLQD